MKLTPSSTARRKTFFAPSRSGGQPQIPSPVRRIAPNPSRLTNRSPPNKNVSSLLLAFVLVAATSFANPPVKTPAAPAEIACKNVLRLMADKICCRYQLSTLTCSPRDQPAVVGRAVALAKVDQISGFESVSIVMPPSRRLLRKYICQTTVGLRRESSEFLRRVAAPPCLQGRRRLCRGRLARRPDCHAGLSDFRSVRAAAANYRAGDRRRISHYPYFNMALRHHTEGHRANRRPTSDWRKPRHATREGGHGSQDELCADSSACDGNRLLRAGS